MTVYMYAKTIKTTVLSFLFGLFICSCGSVSQQKHIPKNATFVAMVDPKSMALNSFEFKDIFNKLSFSSSDSAKTDSTQVIINKLMDSGISLTERFYLFSNFKIAEVASSSLDFFGLFVVSDADKLEESLKTNLKNRNTSLEAAQDGIRFFANDKILIGFKDKIAIVVFNSTTSAFTAATKNLMVSYFNLAESESLYKSNDQFASLFKKDFDVSLWINYDQVIEISKKQTSVLSGSPFPYNFKNASYSVGMKFEKGKIVLKTDYFAQNSGTKSLPLVMDKKIDEKQIEDIAIANPMGLLAFKMNTAACNQLIKDIGYVPQLNQILTRLGLTSDELFQMLDGNIVFSIDKTNVGSGEPSMYAQIGLADTTLFNKFKNSLISQQMLTNNNTYLSSVLFPKLTITSSKNNFRIATSLAMQPQLIEKQTIFLDKNLSNKLKDGSFYMLVDIAALPDYPSEELKVFKENFGYMYMSALQDTKEESSFDMVLETKNPDENALKTLMAVAKELNAIREAKAAIMLQEQEQEMKLESDNTVETPLN